GLEGDQYHQRVLVEVVVEGAEELGQEERQEAAFLHQFELGAHAVVRSKKRRVSNTLAGRRRPWLLRWRFSTKVNSSGLCARISSSTGTAASSSMPSCAKAAGEISGRMPGSG